MPGFWGVYEFLPFLVKMIVYGIFGYKILKIQALEDASLASGQGSPPVQNGQGSIGHVFH
jgi:hypothetical protein